MRDRATSQELRELFSLDKEDDIARFVTTCSGEWRYVGGQDDDTWEFFENDEFKPEIKA